jgi:hypothetical protein
MEINGGHEGIVSKYSTREFACPSAACACFTFIYPRICFVSPLQKGL